MKCPKCDADISDSWQETEPDVGIVGGYYCDACDLAVDGDDRDPMPDDVGIEPAPFDRDRPIGTPLSQLSGQPGHEGYAEFARIARSWGYD